ncbi:hypothetical protein [endosymbiont of Lamellibrachia barhami]|uniref:hypothetical protein n=1 Tax=endosymbiont of Lamellibrachia barhami TaxID=205975 RepID=UPI0015AB58B2|nr:hypothetical protein [endosymbiont of Lamellibrachia barhami]
MSKEKFERTKPHVNVGTIGHVTLMRLKDDFDSCDHVGAGESLAASRRRFDQIETNAQESVSVAFYRLHLPR